MRLIRGILLTIIVVMAGYMIGMALTTTERPKLPPCSPKPYPVTIDLDGLPEDLRPVFRRFVDDMNYRIVDEIYLRFCQYIDTLMDTVFTAIDSIEPSVDTVADIYPECSIEAEIIYPGDCDSILTIAADIVEFLDDTLDTDKSAGQVIFWFRENIDSGSNTIVWEWPLSSETYGIRFPSSAPSDSQYIWAFSGAGSDQRTIKWQKWDRYYTIMKSNYINVAAGNSRDTIGVGGSYVDSSYQVFLTWQDSTHAALGPLSVIVDSNGYQYRSDSFIVQYPGTGLGLSRFSSMCVGILANDQVD